MVAALMINNCYFGLPPRLIGNWFVCSGIADYGCLRLCIPKTCVCIFFAIHILVLGYSVFNTGYIPKSLSVLLILASFTHIVFFVDPILPEALMTIIMLPMAIAERSLSICRCPNLTTNVHY